MQPIILDLILLISTTLSVFAKEPIRSIEGIVAKVSDGDTIQVVDSLGTKSRYASTGSTVLKLKRATGRYTEMTQMGFVVSAVFVI